MLIDQLRWEYHDRFVLKQDYAWALKFDPTQPRDAKGRWIPAGHTSHTELTASYSGQSNFTTRIRDASGKTVAFVDYVIAERRHEAMDRKQHPHEQRGRETVYRPEISISMIEVDPKHRRQGLATALLHTIAQEHKLPITSGMRTDEGGKLWEQWLKRPERLKYERILKFDPNQPRDEEGQWTSTGMSPRNQARQALMDAMGGGPVGVDDHPNAIRAAHETAAVIREMREKGYEMPGEILIQTQIEKSMSGEVSGQTLVINVPDRLPPDVSLDDAYEITYGEKVKVTVIEDWEAREIRKFVGNKFRDLVIHEMGHVTRRDTPHNPYLTLRSTPEERAASEVATEAFRKEMAAIKQFERQARLHVSEYAATNPDEFVAETFTLLYNGQVLPAETMQVYDALRGAKIR